MKPTLLRRIVAEFTGTLLLLAAVVGSDRVDEALGLAAIAGRFGDDDLPAILDHLSRSGPAGELVTADEAHSAQPGTGGWAALGSPAVPA